LTSFVNSLGSAQSPAMKISLKTSAGAGRIVGLDDLSGLFQPMILCI